MGNKIDTPMILSTTWIHAIPHMLAIFAAGYLLQRFQVFHNSTTNFLAGWLLVLIYRYILRFTIIRHHVKGIRNIKAQKYPEAIEYFQKSLQFFKSHPNLDKWRSIVFLSPGRYSYREMALGNMGFAYGQMGDGENAETCYQEVLVLNPNNGAAHATLNLINSKNVEQ